MFNAIINGLMSFIKNFVTLAMTPINILVASTIPDLSNLLTTFNNGVQTYIGGGITYFTTLLPPTVKTCIQAYLLVLIFGYSTMFVVNAFTKVIQLIKNIKIW